jgi:hypothetical protein
MTNDEVVEVNAEVVGDLAELGKYDEWIAGVRDKVAKASELYHPEPITSAKGYSDAKANRAELRRTIGEIDADRKARTRALEDLLSRVRKDTKDVLNTLLTADADYKRNIDAWDAELLSKKRQELSETYQDAAPQLAEYVAFDKVWDRYATEYKWANRSVGVEKCKQQLFEALGEVSNDMKTIDSLDEQDRNHVKALYFGNLDLSASLRTYHEQQERLKSVNEMKRLHEREAQEARNAAKEEQPKKPSEPIIDTHTTVKPSELGESPYETLVVFEVTVPRSKIGQFVAAMKQIQGVHGHKTGVIGNA